MAGDKIKFNTVDEYIAWFPKEKQAVLTAARKAIRKAVPDAEEVISYNIPAFKKNGWLLYISIYTNHFTLSCPPPFAAFKQFEKELSGYKQSKSAIQFPLSEPLPTDLISKIARFNAEQNTQLTK